MQRHLGGDLRQPLHQEVRRAHPHLERAERVLDRLAALTHGLRIFVEAPLHRLQYMLVLPAGDATLLARRAAVLDRAGAARIGPVLRITNSILVGTSTGRSAGFLPFRILSTK